MNTDPIADLLTRMRNAIMVRKQTVEAPSSKLKRELLKIMVKEGFIEKFVVVDDGKQGLMKIKLKYKGPISAIQGMQKVSTPGRRKYASYDKLPRVLNGLGMSIVSTSMGLLTDKQARREKAGGEILCKVW
ncbi:30S ribosomal protein S8 [Fibrobacterota bacterium]